MTIDWDEFSRRVPAGTRVKSLDYDPLEDGLEINEGDEGLVTRHRRNPHDATIREHGINQLFCKFDHLEDEWPMHPTCVDYHIDDRWQSFNEIMEG